MTPLEELSDEEIVWALLAILAERRPISWEDGEMIRRDLEMWRSLCGEVNNA